ncbi:E3 ubiquitin-protein ligase RAD18 [Frankliniella fusca]|uniref:RING-type E3 ubiquitin transferase n=1 Tax=Frankliniella fusca TaxID=407009 RepID=A0AAE1LQT0_9NEOP|nr:E3 ubiquitin-protein ligase RAD18 [Frankliniella fusca]
MDDDELEFSSIPELQELDNVLRCEICHEIIKTPVISSCSHTFCSLCIRKWLATKQVCPSCSETVYESSLRRNPMVENMVYALGNLKKKFQNKNSQQSPVLPCSAIRKTPQPQAKSKKKQRTTNSTFDQDDSNSDSDFLPKKTPPVTPRASTKEMSVHVKSSPSTGTPSRSNKEKMSLPKLQTPLRNVSEKPSTSTDPKSSPAPAAAASASASNVPCPVCSQLMPESIINTHLDKCLIGESTSSSDQNVVNTPSSSRIHNSSNSKTAKLYSPGMSQSHSVKKSDDKRGHALDPIKKMVYHLFKDAQLKKELKKHGLSTTGDRSALLSRLNRYVAFHNAECDATNPRSVEELRKAFDKEDKALAGPPSNSYSKLFSTKQPSIDEFNKHRKDYLKQNKISYDALIEDVKRRNQQKRGSKSVPNGSVASTSATADTDSVHSMSSSKGDTKNEPRETNGKSPYLELSSSDNDAEDNRICTSSKKSKIEVKEQITDQIVLDSSESEIDYSPLGKDSPVKRHSDDSGSDISPDMNRTPSRTSARGPVNVKRKVQCIESESDEDVEDCGRPEKRASLEGRSPVLSRRAPVRRELRSRTSQNKKVSSQPEAATRRSQRNLKNSEEKTLKKPASPDIFGTPSSSVSSDIPCGQPKRKSADSDDALSQLVSIIDDNACSDNGSTTDFED